MPEAPRVEVGGIKAHRLDSLFEVSAGFRLEVLPEIPAKSGLVHFAHGKTLRGGSRGKQSEECLVV
jgi:hypothetical protein